MGRIGFVTALAALSALLPLVLLPLVLFLGGCGPEGAPAPPLERVALVEAHMGTEFRVVAYAEHGAVALAAATRALDRVRALDAALSDYDPQSELSGLSRSAGSGAAVPCSDDLWRVLDAAQGFASDTDGAFDVTAGPLVRQWRRAARQGVPPEPGDLERARAAVGWRKLELDPDARTARLAAPGMRLDLGGIAKGYALDEALRVLRESGVDSALVDGGGDIAVFGRPPGTPGWRLAVEGPRAGAPPVAVVLERGALATSGPAYRGSTIDGVRRSHLLDPRTGEALTRAITVAVRAPDGLTADAVASAVSVLGAEAGLAWVETLPGVEACAWEEGKAGGEPCLSSGFPRTMPGPAAR